MPLGIAQLLNYRGALYPVSYDEPPQEGPPTLVDVCCSFISSDSIRLKAALSIIPCSLFGRILKATLREDDIDKLQIVIEAWPNNILRLGQVIPPAFHGLEVLYNDSAQLEQAKKCTFCINNLVSTFIKCLKKFSIIDGSDDGTPALKLRALDLTGYPINPVTLQYITAHCMLIYKEVIYQRKVDQYNQTIQKIPADLRKDKEFSQFTLPKHSSFPPGSFSIYLDAVIDSEEVLADVAKSCLLSDSDICRFKLRIRHFDVSNCGFKNVGGLLECNERKQFLSGLRLQENQLCEDRLRLLSTQISHFKNLRSIDLSKNLLSSFINNEGDVEAHRDMKQATFRQIGDCFRSLEFLVRLDLSFNHLRGFLHLLIGDSMKSHLQYLKLDSCKLDEEDIDFLASSQHASSLTELNLSNNQLGSSFTYPHVAKLLKEAANKLEICHLANTGLADGALTAICSSASRMVKLIYFDLGASNWSSRTCLACIEKLGHVTSLKVVKISFSRECRRDEEVEPRGAAAAGDAPGPVAGDIDDDSNLSDAARALRLAKEQFARALLKIKQPNDMRIFVD